jgi:hypothetical protein
VAADDDGVDPSWDGSRNALKDDWLAEDGATEDVADLREHEGKPRQGERTEGQIRGRRKPGTYGAIGRTPHLLQLELFHAILIRCDGRALDADVVLENCLGRIDRYLIISLGTWARRIRGDSRSVEGGVDTERDSISHKPHHVMVSMGTRRWGRADQRTASRCSRPRSKYLISSCMYGRMSCRR